MFEQQLEWLQELRNWKTIESQGLRLMFADWQWSEKAGMSRDMIGGWRIPSIEERKMSVRLWQAIYIGTRPVREGKFNLLKRTHSARVLVVLDLYSLSYLLKRTHYVLVRKCPCP